MIHQKEYSDSYFDIKQLFLFSHDKNNIQVTLLAHVISDKCFCLLIFLFRNLNISSCDFSYRQASLVLYMSFENTVNRFNRNSALISNLQNCSKKISFYPLLRTNQIANLFKKQFREVTLLHKINAGIYLARPKFKRL